MQGGAMMQQQQAMQWQQVQQQQMQGPYAAQWAEYYKQQAAQQQQGAQPVNTPTPSWFWFALAPEILLHQLPFLHDLHENMVSGAGSGPARAASGARGAGGRGRRGRRCAAAAAASAGCGRRRAATAAAVVAQETFACERQGGLPVLCGGVATHRTRWAAAALGCGWACGAVCLNGPA